MTQPTVHGTLDLNGTWELLERPLDHELPNAAAVTAASADLQATVPGDVNDALVEAGELPEPLAGLNFRDFSPRVTNRSWWYRRRFRLPPDMRGADVVELALDGLDVHADIWLNGACLGHHASAFCPFIREVTSRVEWDAENTLLIRVTTGSERVADRDDFPFLNIVPTEAGRGYPDRGFKRRVFLRKPVYVWGWDWAPHLPTCGITGNCELRFRPATAIRDVSLRARLTGRGARVHAGVELEHRTLTSTCWGSVVLRLTDEAGVVRTATRNDVLIRSGVTFVDLDLELDAPRFWWPNGCGRQHRYRVEVSLRTSDATCRFPTFNWGLRTVELETRPGMFRFRVNGHPIFIKGGNWVPCDHLYGRTTPARLEKLVDEAAEANFNCLRVWGGGRYELDAFYEACERRGILLWHDFMSACAPLPGDEAFVSLFCSEAEYQVKRLRNRACMLLWCGNNEVGSCYEWGRDEFAGRRDPAWPLYFDRLPHLVKALAPHLPYWPTSPYGGKDSVGNLTVGDDHHWIVMQPEKELWSDPAYWNGEDISIFNSEYGYGGPCCRASTERYLGTDEPDLFNAVGRQHTNAFYDIPRVNHSIRQHYCDPEGLTLDAYILYGGLCQGLNLGDSLESMRANRHTWGGLFWMYNDAWGENGWSIIDYYLRRKIAYYHVKRCLAPQRLVLRRGGQAFGGTDDEILLIGINDTPGALREKVHFGYCSYDGNETVMRDVMVSLSPGTQAIVAACRVPAPDALARGTVMARPGVQSCLDAISWRHCPYREAGIPPADVRIADVRRTGPNLDVDIRTGGFAHAVHLLIDDHARPDDQYFDLLPGQVKTVRIAAFDPLTEKNIDVRWVNKRF